MKKYKSKSKILVVLVSVVGLLGIGFSQANLATMVMPFGSDEDIEYASNLWSQMEQGGFNSKPAILYVGGPPHGPVREVLEGFIDGHRVIVKRNYGGEGVSVQSVEGNRTNFLKAITIMAKRDAGYDTENGDWFWAKYKADGSLHINDKNIQLAGRIAKGMNTGCIVCHQAASGNDLVFAHNKEANADMTIIE